MQLVVTIRSVKGFGRGYGSTFPISLLTCVVAITTLSHYRTSVSLVCCDGGTGGQNDGRKGGRICQHSIALCMPISSAVRPSQNVCGVMDHVKGLPLT